NIQILLPPITNFVLVLCRFAALIVRPIHTQHPPTHPQCTSTLIRPLRSQNRDYEPICIARARLGLSRWEPCSARHRHNC
ncbi:Hypothetical predicted protein, partial [Xyrichtys novacula]